MPRVVVDQGLDPQCKLPLGIRTESRHLERSFTHCLPTYFQSQSCACFDHTASRYHNPRQTKTKVKLVESTPETYEMCLIRVYRRMNKSRVATLTNLISILILYQPYGLSGTVKAYTRSD